MTTAIDLNKLPAPTVVETLAVGTVRDALLADMAGGEPALAGLLPSDPLYKFSELVDYRETLLRQRVNEAALAVMLAHAVGADLDQIGARFGVQRLLIDAGDPLAIPPVAATYEADTPFRLRIQQAFEGLSIAGPTGAYRFHALSADADVQDVGVQSPAPAEVLITVLARSGTGVPSGAVLAAVDDALNDESIRPIGDRVTVQAVSIVTYAIDATLTLYAEADPALVIPAATAAVTAVVEARRRVGQSIPRAALLAALFVEGVDNITLASPAADVTVTAVQAGDCSTIDVVAA